MANINPEVLRWARESAGLSLEDAARAMGIGGVRLSGEEALRRYEAGERQPSRSLLLRMVKAYRRPLLAFYLPSPPQKGERGQDFRTLPAERRLESEGPLDAIVRDVYVRQRLVKTTLEEAEEAENLPFVQSVRMEQGIEEITALVARDIQFDLQRFRRSRTTEEAFKYLRTLVEHRGIFVLLIGNLGSFHSNVSPEVFRGFALADEIAPFIVINDQDARAAWSFTLLHELTHIWLGQSGISGGFAEQKVERFCNDVASQILLPANEIDAWQFATDDVLELMAEISSAADIRKISRTMFAYRLYTANKISRDIWQTVTEKFREQWLRDKAAAKANAGDNGAPTYYVVRRHKVGQALLGLVKRTLAEGILTPTKAGKVLGVRPSNVSAMVDGI